MRSQTQNSSITERVYSEFLDRMVHELENVGHDMVNAYPVVMTVDDINASFPPSKAMLVYGLATSDTSPDIIVGRGGKSALSFAVEFISLSSHLYLHDSYESAESLFKALVLDVEAFNESASTRKITALRFTGYGNEEPQYWVAPLA